MQKRKERGRRHALARLLREALDEADQKSVRHLEQESGRSSEKREWPGAFPLSTALRWRGYFFSISSIL